MRADKGNRGKMGSKVINVELNAVVNPNDFPYAH